MPHVVDHYRLADPGLRHQLVPGLEEPAAVLVLGQAVRVEHRAHAVEDGDLGAAVVHELRELASDGRDVDAERR
ncbi:hypothetical protein, partial [Mycobacterium sp. 1274761.0]|uniref:hypothetical protein n=1 Tax=Mycobacterium sp. 1274761.0 TaxID=1834077 RepID=UPI001E2FB58F